MTRSALAISIVAVIATTSHAPACTTTGDRREIQIATDKAVYHNHESITISISMEKADYIAGAGIADSVNAGLGAIQVTRNGSPLAPDASPRDSGALLSGGGPVDQREYEARSTPGHYILVRSRALDTLGYASLPPGQYTLSIRTNFFPPGGAVTPVAITTNCVHFTVE